MIKTIGNSILLVVFVLSMIACSGVPRPNTEMSLSESAIKDAESAGARKYAPLEFRRANEKYAEAASAMKNKDYALAREKSDESRVDAELAEAKSHAEKSSIDTRTLRANLDRLHQAKNKKKAVR